MGRGEIVRPSGSTRPPSSNRTTPLQSRLQPWSGWPATTRAAARSGAPGGGHGVRCWHILAPPLPTRPALCRARTDSLAARPRRGHGENPRTGTYVPENRYSSVRPGPARDDPRGDLGTGRERELGENV